MKTVFLFISNSIHTSDLLRTEYIHELASRFRVVVFLPHTFHADIYPEIQNVIYKTLPLYNEKLWGRSKEFRLTLNRMNEEWWEPTINRGKVDFPHREKLRLIARCIPRGVIRNSTFTFLESFFSRKIPELQAAVEKYHPLLFLVPTPGLKPFEAQAIVQARKFDIPSVAMNFSWDNLTSNFAHIRKTDYIICWNDLEYQDAIAFHGYTAATAFIAGPLRFDYYFNESLSKVSRASFLHKKGLDPKRKTILLTSVTKSYPFQVTLLKRLLALRDAGKIAGAPNIFFRIHPRDLIETYREFAGTPNFYMEKAGSEIIDKTGKAHGEMTKDDLLNLKHTLMHSDVNVNHISTMTIECCIFNTPVVNITFDDVYGLMYKQRHYNLVLRHGASTMAKTDDELAEAINAYLENPNLHKERREALIKEFIPYTDGNSYRRNVDIIERIAH